MKDDDDDEHGFMRLIFDDDDSCSLLTLNRGSNNNQRKTILLKRNVPFCITRVYVWGSLFPEKFGGVVFYAMMICHTCILPYSTLGKIGGEKKVEGGDDNCTDRPICGLRQDVYRRHNHSGMKYSIPFLSLSIQTINITTTTNQHILEPHTNGVFYVTCTTGNSKYTTARYIYTPSRIHQSNTKRK